MLLQNAAKPSLILYHYKRYSALNIHCCLLIFSLSPPLSHPSPTYSSVSTSPPISLPFSPSSSYCTFILCYHSVFLCLPFIHSLLLN